MAKAVNFIPQGYHTITPQLSLDRAAQTMDWYKKALGAEEIGRNLGPDGTIVHAEMKIGDSRFMVNESMKGKGPKALGGSPAGFWIYTDNSDGLFKRAVDAGAKVEMPLEDQFWGDRAGAIVDPEGYTWWIATKKEELTKAELEQRASEFFAKMAPSAR